MGHPPGLRILRTHGAPLDVIMILQPGQPGIVGVLHLGDLGIGAGQCETLVADIPVDAILAPTQVQIGHAGLVFGAEDAHELILKGQDRAVVNGIGAGNGMAVNDGITGIPPNQLARPFGLLLSGEV